MSDPIPYSEEVKRKLVHLSSLWMPLAILFLPRAVMIGVFAFCLVGNLIVEYLRAKRVPGITPVYDALFGRMLREEPRPGQWIISGGPSVFASALTVTCLAPSPVAAASMAVMLLGDTAAALVGRRFGRHKFFNGKSLEGCIAFLAAGYAGAMIFLQGAYWPEMIPAVFAGMLVEFFEKNLHLDDNFSIPVVTALVWAGLEAAGW